MDALRRNVEQLDELVTRERRDGDDRVGAPHPVAKRDATRVPVPGREGVGVPEQGAVVDGDDHGKPRAQRPAHRRAMEHVRRPRLVRDAERVPREVADDGRRTPVTVEADRQELELRPALERSARCPCTTRAVPAPVWASGETSNATFTEPPRSPRASPRRPPAR